MRNQQKQTSTDQPIGLPEAVIDQFQAPHGQLDALIGKHETPISKIEAPIGQFEPS